MSKQRVKSPGKQYVVKGAGKIVKTELVPFTRQISSMLNAGMTILSSVATLEEQSSNPNFKLLLKTLRENVESGLPFSEGLEMFPQVFDEMYVNMVTAGERSGQFAPVLKRLAVMLDTSARLVRKVKSSMTYPTVVLSLALMIAVALIAFVVPIFAEMFEGFGSKLPFATQILVDASDFMRAYWYLLAGGMAFLVVVFRLWKRSAAGRLAFDKMILRLPVFGELMQKVAVARFSRLFAQMLVSGVPILDAMEIVARSLGNKAVEQSILEARGGVEQGKPLSESLAGRPFLPVLMVRMIGAGEQSGRVDEMLDSVADTYDDEVETTLAALTSLMEPLLMVFLGVVIGGIVIAMYLPIFRLDSVINN